MEYEVRHYRGGKLIEVVGANLNTDGTNGFTFDKPVEQWDGDSLKVFPKRGPHPSRRYNG